MDRKEKWVVAAKKDDFASIAEHFGIDQVTARLIRNRGVIGMDAVQEYLHGNLDSLNDPVQMKGCLEAAELLALKIREKKKIRIIGDYDIDGVCSVYILYSAISECLGMADYDIPDRIKDGFGLNMRLVEDAVSDHVDTIITCDNGIAAINEVARAREQGITVIITDHHELLYETANADIDKDNIRLPDAAVRIPAEAEGRIYLLPPANVVADPHRPDCAYPYKKLCGAAVAWKVVCLLYSIMGKNKSNTSENASVDELLMFAGFATVGDIMDLDGENRILVKAGLELLHRTKNRGLCALIRVNNLDQQAVTAYHIGFVLGPCINASGRLDSAKRVLELLLAGDDEEAYQAALHLKELNDERKEMTEKAAEQAFGMIEGNIGYQRDRVLVIYLPDCHESIAGIVAGRLRERYFKPSFVITDSSGVAKGSGRSIETYSMYDEMVKCQDLFIKFGGHPMAAGFSLEKEKIQEMRTRLNDSCTLTEDDLTEKILIDVPMPINYITEKVIKELSLLEPCGKGNEKPLFGERSLYIASAKIIGENRNTVKLRVRNKNGCTMNALYFGDPEEFKAYLTQKYGEKEVQNLFMYGNSHITMDLTYYPSIDEYMGRKTLQIVIQNYR